MSVKLPLADPTFPQLQVAGDPESMRGVFRKHLRPLNNKAYHVRDCRLSRIRYRRGNRCVLQYTLRLAEADTEGMGMGVITLPLLIAEPMPELKLPLLARFGPGNWRTEGWNFEPVRYRAGLGAALRLTVQGQDDATGSRKECFNANESLCERGSGRKLSHTWPDATRTPSTRGPVSRKRILR